MPLWAKSEAKTVMSYPLPTDPQLAAYLQHLRDREVKAASKCQICGRTTVGINADGYRVVFVCEKHLDKIVPVQIIDDMPNVVHRVYPEGLDVPSNMMDPNVGGKLGE